MLKKKTTTTKQNQTKKTLLCDLQMGVPGMAAELHVMQLSEIKLLMLSSFRKSGI